MNHNLQRKLSSLENLIKVQKDSLEKGYMHGLLNGLICAHSVITDDKANFVDCPKTETRVRYRKKAKR